MEFFTPAVWQLRQLLELQEQLPAHSSWWICILVQKEDGDGKKMEKKKSKNGNMSYAN